MSPSLKGTQRRRITVTSSLHGSSRKKGEWLVDVTPLAPNPSYSFRSWNVKKLLRNKLRFTWGWAEVLSMDHIVHILNWAAWPEAFSLSLLCVCIFRGARPEKRDWHRRIRKTPPIVFVLKSLYSSVADFKTDPAAKLWVKRQIDESRAWIDNENR